MICKNPATVHGLLILTLAMISPEADIVYHKEEEGGWKTTLTAKSTSENEAYSHGWSLESPSSALKEGKLKSISHSLAIAFA